MADTERRSKWKRDLARELRKSATGPEARLWHFLRNKQLGGVKFRRQHPFGAFIADFYCPAAKLIVELDGEQHGEPRQYAYDAARTRWLEAEGYSVLRFNNREVLMEIRRVLDVIWRTAVAKGVTPPRSTCRASTLPQGEGPS